MSRGHAFPEHSCLIESVRQRMSSTPLASPDVGNRWQVTSCGKADVSTSLGFPRSQCLGDIVAFSFTHEARNPVMFAARRADP